MEYALGALINNSCEDGRPLMLSANHCLSGGVSSWAFPFQLEGKPRNGKSAQIQLQGLIQVHHTIKR